MQAPPPTTTPTSTAVQYNRLIRQGCVYTGPFFSGWGLLCRTGEKTDRWRGRRTAGCSAPSVHRGSSGEEPGRLLSVQRSGGGGGRSAHGGDNTSKARVFFFFFLQWLQQPLPPLRRDPSPSPLRCRCPIPLLLSLMLNGTKFENPAEDPGTATALQGARPAAGGRAERGRAEDRRGAERRQPGGPSPDPLASARQPALLARPLALCRPLASPVSRL